MTTAAERQRARLRGSTKAVQRWTQLGLNPDTSVAIFDVIESESVWLLFEPLDHLYGFFKREAEAAGIVVHSKHPVTVQRFTAAHEYGHFVLGHEESHDTKRELYSSEEDVELQEIEAQAFAAEFLMPLAVVNRALDRLHLAREPQGISPDHAYQLSLELGSSYRATVTQLRQLNKLRANDVTRLTGFAPIDIKASLGDGRKPADSWADAWLVEKPLAQRQVRLRTGDELHIRLTEIPSSGYRWIVEGDTVEGRLELLEDHIEPGDGDPALSRRVGTERLRHLWWRAVNPGDGPLTLRLKRGRSQERTSVGDALDVGLSVSPPRVHPEIGRGISASQRDWHVRRQAA